MQAQNELSELVVVASEIRRQLGALTAEATTMREMSRDIKLMRGEMEQGSQAIQSVSARVEQAASKLLFLDPQAKDFPSINN